MVHLKALLPPEVGAAAFEYLDAHASPRVRFTDLNDPNPTPVGDGTGELIDTRTREQKMADGLARAFQTASAAGNVPAQGGATPVLTVTISAGEVLLLGRTQRLFSPKQKQALAVTYKTCAAGGCDIPARWCEGHHVIPWSKGGSTDLPEGVLVCNFHHHQIHQGNLVAERPPGSRRIRIRRRHPRQRIPDLRAGSDDPARHGR